VAYVYLLVAIGSEVFGTSMLKATEGFSRLWPTVACLAGYVLSFVALAQAVKSVPVAVVYALWSGLGSAAIVAIGAMFLGEPITVVKLVGVALIVAGVVVLNVGGAAAH
jgi:small multidrug resistance pump